MIFVDELFEMTPRTEQARRHGNKWCHMTTDGTIEELHQMAEKLGLKRSYFQRHATLPHYDLTPPKRALAVRLGAKEITMAEKLQKAREKAQLEQAILKAAENADDNLQDLIQIAIEHMDEAQANRLLDKVHQVQKESLQDIRGWKD